RIPRSDAPCHEDQKQGVGPAGAGNDVACAAESRKLGFDRAYFRALDELAMGEHPRNRVINGAPEAAALCRDVDEWDRRLVESRVLIHWLVQARLSSNHPATRRGPLRCWAAA